MSHVYGFLEKFIFSKGQLQANDLATIKKMIPGCADVLRRCKCEAEPNKLGSDFFAA
jgi:hypothetical protein